MPTTPQAIKRRDTDATDLAALEAAHPRSDALVGELFAILPKAARKKIPDLLTLLDDNAPEVPTMLEVNGAHIVWSTVDYPNGQVNLDVAGNIVSVSIDDVSGVFAPDELV